MAESGFWTPAPMPPAPCPYCAAEVRLHPSSAGLYRGIDYGPVWLCSGCGAYVNCHRGTTQPLGRVADKELRAAKMYAHAAFDPLWKRKMRRDGCSKKQARNAGYQWLADQLGIEMKHCHIGLFDTEMCRRVIDVCADVYAKERTT